MFLCPTLVAKRKNNFSIIFVVKHIPQFMNLTSYKSIYLATLIKTRPRLFCNSVGEASPRYMVVH